MVSCTCILAQKPSPTAITDAASFVNRVAPGSLATLFGTGIATKNVNASTIPLPFILGGVQITVDGFRAAIIFTGVDPYPQVNFQMPSEVQPGTANLVVTVNGVDSDPLPVTITSTAPGIFAYDPFGGTLDPTELQVVAQNPPQYNNSNINSPSNPAPAGSVVVAYMDGTGALRTPVEDGFAATGSDSARASASATIGGEPAGIQYIGLTPGNVGLAQANVVIPDDLPSGDYPLVLTVGGLVSTSAFISVSGQGTLPTFLEEVALFNDFAVSQRTTIQVNNGILYLCGREFVRVFDVTDPPNSTFLGAYGGPDLNGHEISCTLNDTVASPYLASVVGPESHPTATVFDVTSDPTTPTVIAEGVSLGGFTDIQRFAFDGEIGIANSNYIDANGVQQGDILAFDFSDPTDPQVISGLSTGQLQSFIRISAASHVFYSVGGTATDGETGGVGALDVIDTTDLSNLEILSEVHAHGTAVLESFAVSGTTLLAAGNSSDAGEYFVPDIFFHGTLTLTTFDVSDPLNPVPLATLDTGIPSAGSLRTVRFNVANGGPVFLVQYQPPLSDVNGPTSLGVVDASDPTNPVFYPQFTYYYYDGLGIYNGYVFAATGNGMNIYKSVPQ